jgi:ubiquinone/menaquinone biosynthesis C-methylase UbiE
MDEEVLRVYGERMIWPVVIIFFTFLIGLGVVFGMRRMNIPREPDREGIMDHASIQSYDSVSHWPIFSFMRHIILGALGKDMPEGKLVDIGCGPGFLLADISRHYHHLKIYGIDLSKDMITLAQKHTSSGQNLQLIIGDSQNLPLSNSSVDFVVSSLSLHHWANAKDAFIEMNRVLKPGGSLLLFDLRRDSSSLLYYSLKVGQRLFAPPAIRHSNGAVGSIWASYTPHELTTMLSQNGFDRIHVGSSIGWILAKCVKANESWLHFFGDYDSAS